MDQFATLRKEKLGHSGIYRWDYSSKAFKRVYLVSVVSSSPSNYSKLTMDLYPFVKNGLFPEFILLKMNPWISIRVGFA